MITVFVIIYNYYLDVVVGVEKWYGWYGIQLFFTVIVYKYGKWVEYGVRLFRFISVLDF